MKSFIFLVLIAFHHPLLLAESPLPASRATQVVFPPSPTPNTVRCTSDEVWAELDSLDAYLDEVCIALKENYPGIGSGWCGNVSGSGPKCDVVANFIQNSWMKNIKFNKPNLRCLTFGYILDPGNASLGLLQHTYFGVINSLTGELIRCIDPWRFGDCEMRFPKECPNSGTFNKLR